MLRFETQYSGDYFQNLFMPFGEQPQRRPVVAASNPRLVALLDTYLDRLLTSMLRAMFGEGTVTPEIKSQLADLTIASCVTDWIPPGVPKTDIYSMARKGLRPDLRAGVVIHAKEQSILAEGNYKNSVEHKYSYNAVQYKIPAYGWSSTKHRVGIWFINPTIEYLSGGASKQELVCHFGDNDNPDPTHFYEKSLT
jgi:hypothetical protein